MMWTRGTRGRAGVCVGVALLAAGGLAACGDDDDDASASREQLVAAADAICQRIDAEGSRLSEEVYGADFSLEPSLDQQAEFLRELVAGVEDAFADIEALPGPEDGKAILARVFGEDPFIEEARAAIALADAGDEPGFEAAMGSLFSGESDPDPAVVDAARDYGFEACVPADGGADDEDHEGDDDEG